jgi:hypothetical protein
MALLGISDWAEKFGLQAKNGLAYLPADMCGEK